MNKPIYVVLQEKEDYPEDRTKEIIYVGTDGMKAVLQERLIGYRLFLELWENDKAVCGYTNDSGKWEHDFGEELLIGLVGKSK